MKKLIYISGIIAAIVLTIGTSFKIQHWPGAGILLTISITFFTLFFIPAALLTTINMKKRMPIYISVFF